jgi:phosphoglycolate phosphatase-like HAD superfamily hydrolase
VPSQIIFDLDQTLVAGVIDDVYRAFLADQGRDVEAAMSYLHSCQGMPLFEQLAALWALDVDDPQIDLLADRFWQLYGDRIAPAHDGATETLHGLHDRGITLLLSTGTHPEVVERILTAHGWSDLFALALGGSRGLLKGPQHYAAFHALTGLTAEAFATRTWTVGDGSYDMIYGLQQGVPVRIGYAPNPAAEAQLLAAGATTIISDLRELLVLADERR